MTQSGGTRRQLRARANYRPSQNFLDMANKSLTAEYKLRPDSSFSQDDLDRFNRRQDEYRGNLSRTYGSQYLKPVQRYDRVEDIPRYTEEELREQKIERLKANPRSAYNYKRPQTPEFGKGPQNQKVPQAVVDSYNSLIGKFRNLRDTGNQNSVSQADFDNVLNALRDSPPEYIQEGEVYEGPDFQTVDGGLLRERPDSIFYRGNQANQGASQATAPAQTFGETREIGRSRSAPSRQQAATPRQQATPSRQQAASPRQNRQARPERMSYAERNQIGTYSPSYIESRNRRNAAREQFANTPQAVKDLQREFSRNGATDKFKQGLYGFNKTRYEERYGDQSGGSGSDPQSGMSQPAAPSYKRQPNPMPNGRSDRGNYSRRPPSETATSTPTRRSFNPELAGRGAADRSGQAAGSTPSRRTTSASSRATVNTSRANRKSREFAVEQDAQRKNDMAARSELNTVRGQGAADRAEQSAPSPRSRSRRSREARVAADARANRRNRRGADASTRSNRRAQRERAVVDRQRAGRGRSGGGRRGGRGRARGAAQ